MWRKTRVPHSHLCFGADPNRNFDAHFGEAGTSDSPCSEIYRGPRPFSEPETLALSQFMRNFTNVKLYLSFHSYGQYLMFPYVSKRRAVTEFTYYILTGYTVFTGAHLRSGSESR